MQAFALGMSFMESIPVRGDLANTYGIICIKNGSSSVFITTARLKDSVSAKMFICGNNVDAEELMQISLCQRVSQGPSAFITSSAVFSF